ncbi:prepilin peptidase [Candidatus Saccharibacteria bacterium]|nr:prepilin peptidase [Candidatus Saccharibacteria bacterium]
MQVLFCLLMFVFGAGLGSFLCCQVRRLRRHEKHQKSLGPRSVCLHCGKKLRWYENIPLISWCLQKGKCRHCGKKIGLAEILAELSAAVALATLATRVNVHTATPLEWGIFAATVIFTLILLFLAIYDGLYGELPTVFLTISIICAIIIAALKVWASFSNLHPPYSQFSWSLILEPLGSALLLGGLYLVLYLVSRGRWVGDGDWLLATAIGLALGRPFAALVALFAANFAACLISAPSAIKRHSHQIYFGPFLVLGYLLGAFFMN